MKVKGASLDLIALANGLPTTDELREAATLAEKARVKSDAEAFPRYMNSSQRRKFRKTIERQQAAQAEQA